MKFYMGVEETKTIIHYLSLNLEQFELLSIILHSSILKSLYKDKI